MKQKKLRKKYDEEENKENDADKDEEWLICR